MMRIFHRTLPIQVFSTFFLILSLEWYRLDTQHWFLWLATALAGACVWWFAQPQTPAYEAERQLSRLLWLVIGYAVFQLIPLPLFLLGLLSPNKAHLARALADFSHGYSFSPISVKPSLGWEQLVRVGGYILVFLATCKLYRTCKDWTLVYPIFFVAVLEALIGLAQYASNPAVERASGTLINPDHFSAYLEMVLPFAVMLCVLNIMRWRTAPEGMARVRHAVVAGCGALMALLMLLAIAQSVSRIGLVTAFASISVCGILMMPRQWSAGKRWGIAAGLLAGALVAVFLFAPARLVTRISGAADSPNVMNDHLRIGMWTDTLRMIRDYPVFGVGLGAFRSAFPGYQSSDLEHSVIYSHNDYLQLTSELGIAGMVVLFLIVLPVFQVAIEASNRGAHRQDRMLGVACTGSLAAIAVHSFFDFNLYIPPVALLTSIVAGMAVGLFFELMRREHPDSTPVPGALRMHALRLAGFVAAYSVLALILIPRLPDRLSLERFACGIGYCADDKVAADGFAKLLNPTTRAAGIGIFERLAARDVASPFVWVDLAQAYLFNNRQMEADGAVAQAVRLAPNQPFVLFRTASYYNSRGQRAQAIATAFRLMSKVTLFDASVAQLFQTMRVTVPEVLAAANAPGVEFPGCRAARSYFASAALTADPKLPSAWAWLTGHSCADDRTAGAFVDDQIKRNRPAEAFAAWRAYRGSGAGDLLSNGDFERNPSGGRFDWRFDDPSRARVIRDPKQARGGSAVLRLVYGGNDLDPPLLTVSQTVFLTPGKYRLEAEIRRQDIPSDHGIGIRVVDPAIPAALKQPPVVTTARLTGTKDWEKVAPVFDVVGAPRLFEVQVVRMKAEVALGAPSGSAWIDNLHLVPVGR